MLHQESYQELYFPEDYQQLYPDVQVTAKYSLDGEIESFDLMIDGMYDDLHCYEFASNRSIRPSEKMKARESKRARARERAAQRELSGNFYDENGNRLRKPT